MTIYYITGLCEVLFKAIFFYFEKREQNYNHSKFVVEHLPYGEVLSKKKDMSEHKGEQKILQAFTQVK